MSVVVDLGCDLPFDFLPLCFLVVHFNQLLNAGVPSLLLVSDHILELSFVVLRSLLRFPDATEAFISNKWWGGGTAGVLRVIHVEDERLLLFLKSSLLL